MKHIETIQALIKTLLHSDSFHALIVESAPGTGKSTTINRALGKLSVKAVSMGSYATPLHIYRMLCQHPSSILVLDDCHGALSDPKAMAILKAATWQNDGEAKTRRGRRVSWGSSSEKVEQPFCDFSGKLILLTNSVPSGKESEAFLSRCLSYRIRFSEAEVRKLILTGAKSRKYFPDAKQATGVAEFLVDKRNGIELLQVNLRTVKLGYDLAVTHPESWRELFMKLLPLRMNVEEGVMELFSSGLSAKEQEERFCQLTGMSRRTYYVYKKEFGLSRSYRN